jgi:hypothetical protein
MVCQSKSAQHCLCGINYPYRRIAPASDNGQVRATQRSGCTLSGSVSTPAPDQTLGFEANMDLVSLSEFLTIVPATAKFGTYLERPKSGHFCVDKGRRTVDGRRLSWLWIFPDGEARPSNKLFITQGLAPQLVWTKAAIQAAYPDESGALPIFTRHKEIYSELAITFCLPFP